MQYRINIETGRKVNDNGQLGASFYNQNWRKATTTEVKAIELKKLKEAKILEAKAKREEKLSNFIVDEGVIETNNLAKTILILKDYKLLLIQNIAIAEYSLKDGKLVSLDLLTIDKWLSSISNQVNQAWLDYRAIVKKINNIKTIITLNKIEIK